MDCSLCRDDAGAGWRLSASSSRLPASGFRLPASSSRLAHSYLSLRGTRGISVGCCWADGVPWQSTARMAIGLLVPCRGRSRRRIATTFLSLRGTRGISVGCCRADGVPVVASSFRLPASDCRLAHSYLSLRGHSGQVGGVLSDAWRAVAIYGQIGDRSLGAGPR
jgi:hypothetical protein